MSSCVPTYRTLRMSSCGIPGGGEQIHEDRGRKGVDMSFGVGYRGDIAVENTQLWLEEIPSASMTIRYIKRMYVYTYIYICTPPSTSSSPPSTYKQQVARLLRRRQASVFVWASSTRDASDAAPDSGVLAHTLQRPCLIVATKITCISILITCTHITKKPWGFVLTVSLKPITSVITEQRTFYYLLNQFILHPTFLEYTMLINITVCCVRVCVQFGVCPLKLLKTCATL